MWTYCVRLSSGTTIALSVMLCSIWGLSSGCRGRPPLSPTEAALLQRAIADAAEATPEEEDSGLVALLPGDPRTSFRTTDGVARVLLAVWTGWDGYAEQVGQEVRLGRSQWSVIPSELRSFCRDLLLSGEARDRRLEQYLGLRPRAGKTHVALMWVAPKNVVRPCPDPEVTDRRCSATAEAEDVVIGQHHHRQWFEDLRKRSYREDGYPWTRLGYTYDWSPDTPERGISEFLIPQGTAVRIASYSSTDEFCQ